MIKSKHFRKDVIIARVIFLALCALVIAAVVWVVSLLTGPGKTPTPPESESSESSESSELESESESGSESESESESETESTTEPESETPTDEPTKYYVQVTSTRNLNLRKEPNTTSEVLTSLPTGTKAELLEEIEGWYKINYKGRVGYISSDYAKIVEE